MKISVIIPTFKPQDYLWECLDSIKAQTFPKNDFEIVIVLNGCCEPYKSEIEKYLADNMSDMNVNFIHTDQPGVSNARNVGLDVAKGEYITFVDDDDYVSQVYLEELYNKADMDVVSVSNTIAYSVGGGIKTTVQSTEFRSTTTTGRDMGCSHSIRRSVSLVLA